MGIFDKLRQKTNTKSEHAQFVPGVGRMPYPAYRGKESYLFVSYAHMDSERVFAEIKRFNEAGFHVWYDEGIAPGNEWTEEIAAALANCSLFVVMITPNSAPRINVQNEINFALRRNKPFLAIHLEEAKLPPGLELQIGTKQAILKYNMIEEEYNFKYIEAFTRLGLNRHEDTTRKCDNQATVLPVQTVLTTESSSKPAEIYDDSPDDAKKRANGDLVRVDGFDIEHGFLKGYYGQEKNIKLPNAAVILGYSSFGKSQRFIESVDLNKAGVLFDGSFENCPHLHTVIIPETVTTIKMNAFIGCPKLTLYVRKSQLPDGFEAHFCGKEIVCLDEISTSHAPAIPSSATIFTVSTEAVKKPASQIIPSSASDVRIPLTEGNGNSEETCDLELKEHSWGNFVPRGTAEITLSDGTKIEAIANSLLCYTAKMEKNVGTNPRLYEGLDNYHDDNNYHLEDMVLFADMQSIKRQGDILLVTDYEEETTEIRLIQGMTLWCLDGASKNKHNSIPFSEIEEVFFHRRETPDFAIGLCKITMQNGIFSVPSAYLHFLIDINKIRNSFPNMKITTDLAPLSGFSLDLKRIRTFSVVKILKAAEMYSPETEAEIEVNLKNEEICKFTFKSRISIYALAGNGILRCFGIEKLKSIELS